MKLLGTKATSTTLVVLGLGATLAGTAQAQGIGSVLPVRVKVGVLLPSQGDTKSRTADTFFSGEVDVDLPAAGLGRRRVTVGYAQSVDGGQTLRVIPVTLSQVFSPPNPASGLTGNVYFGLGAGAYFTRASGIPVAEGETDSESKTLLGGFAMAGYQFPNAFFVEGKYHLVSGKVAGLSPNGIAVLLGRRF